MESSSLLVLTLLARGNIVHYFLYVLVSGSPFLGVWVLLVEFGTLDSSGDDFVRGAMLGSILDTLSAPVLAFGRISHNFYVDVDSVRYVSLFSRGIERCSVDASPEFLLRCPHLEICTLILRRFVADWWFDGDGHFCCIFSAFFDLLF